MVFVPFTGINHHNRCLTFASGLLADESAGAYKWLLDQFKEAFGKDPDVVITDQDPSMKIAIAECFPNTRHRLCMWHIMQKLTTKVFFISMPMMHYIIHYNALNLFYIHALCCLRCTIILQTDAVEIYIIISLFLQVGTALCSSTDFKRRICDIVWTDQIFSEEFEREWECMINDFELCDNKWLGDMFNMRERWIPAYLHDVLMAGLMRTTSRSESENHFFGKWTSPHLTLVEFLSHYDTAIEYQRYIERKNDHDSRYKTPVFKTDLLMEKEACKLYTRTLFFDVQDEIYASYKYCIALSVDQVENMEKYAVRDTQYHNGSRGDNDFPVYQVCIRNIIYRNAY